MSYQLRYLLCTLSVFISFTAFSQDDSTAASLRHQRLMEVRERHQKLHQMPFSKAIKRLNKERPPLDLANRLIVKITPSSLIDPVGPILPISLEYYFYKRGSIQLGFAYPSLHVIDQGKNAHKDFFAKAEIKQYVKIRAVTRNFVGVEAFYRAHDYADEYGDLTRQTIGGGAFYGRSYKLFGNFFLDWHAGIGLLHWVNDYNEVYRYRTNSAPREYETLSWIDQFRINEGFGVYPSLGINIAYVLGKKVGSKSK